MKNKEDKFPCVMIHPLSGLVVQMEGRRGSNGFGIVVGTGHAGYYVIGEYRDTWTISNFKLFDGVSNGNE